MAHQLPHRPHEQRQQDERIQPHGVAQVGSRPQAPGVPQRQHARPPSAHAKAPPQVEHGGQLHAPQLERIYHKDEEREVRLVKEGQEQVEGARQVVAVEAPRVGSQPARSGVEDRLPPGKHPLEPGKEVYVLKDQVLRQEGLRAKRIHAAHGGHDAQHGNGNNKPGAPEDQGSQFGKTEMLGTLPH